MSSLCVAAGVEIATASAPAAARSSSESNVRRPRVVRLDQGPPLGRRGDHAEEVALGAAPSSGAWNHRPPKPYPTSPIRTGSIPAPAVMSES